MIDIFEKIVDIISLTEKGASFTEQKARLPSTIVNILQLTPLIKECFISKL